MPNNVANNGENDNDECCLGKHHHFRLASIIRQYPATIFRHSIRINDECDEDLSGSTGFAKITVKMQLCAVLLKTFDGHLSCLVPKRDFFSKLLGLQILSKSVLGGFRRC